jgi:hypothetical protein
MAGKARATGVARENIEKRVSRRFYRRAAKGGEGRVRNWERYLCFRFSFVHVFNGYVASLSMTILDNNDL